MTLPALDRRLTANVYRHEGTIRSLEVVVDSNGGVTVLSLELDKDPVEVHGQVRLTIMGPQGVHFDEVLPLATPGGWGDLLATARNHSPPLPETGIEAYGTQVRVAPYENDEALQSKHHLALQAPLDAIPGEGHLVHGAWSAEWPGSYWNSAVVLGGEGALSQVFVIAAEPADGQDVHWRVYRVGERDSPLVQSQLGDGKAMVAWTDEHGWTGIDLTPDFEAVTWDDLREAVLELATTPAGKEPDDDTRWLHVPITAR